MKRLNLLDRGAGRVATAVVAAAALLALAGFSGQKSASKGSGSAPQTASDSSLQEACPAPATWFPETPEPDFTTIPENFCDFHRLAWQSFLWLTADVGDGRLRFETFPTAQDAIDGRRPGAGNATLRLSPRIGKRGAPLDEVTQANENGIVVDQNGRAVYYSQQLNDQMLQEIVGNRWNDPAVLNEIDPRTEFALGDIELKTAWKIVEDGEDTSGFIVRDALVGKLINVHGTIQIDSKNPIPARVALVGMHVVFVVQGHPEFIWATFEHNNNAPDFTAGRTPTQPVSNEDWTFYKAGTPAIECNQINASTLTLDEETQRLHPKTQVCRQYPYGMPAGAANQLNLITITTLNESVWSQLPEDSVIRHYFEVGAVWQAFNSLQVNSDLQDDMTGSVLLANSVIETFNQAIASQNNCFSCHNTLMFSPDDPDVPPLQGTNLNLSHIILEAYEENSSALRHETSKSADHDIDSAPADNVAARED